MKLPNLFLIFLVSLASSAFSLPLQKVIFIVPGTFVSAESYFELAEAIKENIADDVLIERATFRSGFPLRVGVEKQLRELNIAIREQGFEPDITVLAHSQGGIAAGNLPKNLAARSVILASYQRSDWFTKPVPVVIPTLTIGGTRDVLTPPQRIALEAFDKRNESSPHKFLLLDGVNHFQFVDGRKSNRDGVSSLSVKEAHAKIAKFVSAFMNGRWSSLENDDDMIFSAELLNGFFNSFMKDQGLCKEAQFHHLGLIDGTDLLEVEITSYDKQTKYPQFILDKSSINQEDDSYLVKGYQYTERPPSPIDVKYFKSVTPEVVGCKLRSADDVSRTLGVSLKSGSCLEMNLKVLRETALTLPESEKRRLAQYIDLDFDADIFLSEDKDTVAGFGFDLSNKKLSRGDQWALMSLFDAEIKDEKLAIVSDSVTTPVGDPGNPFYGAHYCKVIPPSKAFSYLLSFPQMK